MDQEELNTLLENHKKWINDDSGDQANLRWANLRWAELSGADLSGAKYSIFSVIRSNWGIVSDALCREMMRWDAISCGDAAMSAWAKRKGRCPFKNSGRELYFSEKRELWEPGAPTMNHRRLWEALCKEKNIKI